MVRPGFFQDSRRGCSSSHVALRAKEKPPPTQLAASDVYMSQSLLAYTFRDAIGRCRASRRGFVFGCCVHLSSRRWLLPSCRAFFLQKSPFSFPRASHFETSAWGQSRKLLPRSLRLAISTYPSVCSRTLFGPRAGLAALLAEKLCLCAPAFSPRGHGALRSNFKKSPLCCLGQSFSHVCLGTKEEAPPTQLAASHVYIS